MEAIDIRYEQLELDSLPELTTLQSALIQRGIKILNTDDVKQYQKERADRANANMIGVTKRVGQVSFILAFAMAFGFLWTAIHHIHPIAAWILGPGATISLILAVSCADRLIGYRNPLNLWQWCWKDLPPQSNFVTTRNGVIQVPENVAAINNQIFADTGVCGFVTFFREDPFLSFVDWDHTEYYVAVWDEKGFVLPS